MGASRGSNGDLYGRRELRRRDRAAGAPLRQLACVALPATATRRRVRSRASTVARGEVRAVSLSPAAATAGPQTAGRPRGWGAQIARGQPPSQHKSRGVGPNRGPGSGSDKDSQPKRGATPRRANPAQPCEGAPWAPPAAAPPQPAARPVQALPRPEPNASTQRISHPTQRLTCQCHGHPNRNPPFWAIKRPARPHKTTTTERRFTMGTAKAA
jgi:hypothetical protein